MSAWWSDWRVQRERLLALDALVIGLAYSFGPSDWQTSGTLSTLRELPGGMRTVGHICLGLWILLVVSRAVTDGPGFARFAHAVGAGIYFLMAVAQLATLIIGTAESAGGPIHLLIIAWLHYRAGIERPPFRRRDGR